MIYLVCSVPLQVPELFRRRLLGLQQEGGVYVRQQPDQLRVSRELPLDDGRAVRQSAEDAHVGRTAHGGKGKVTRPDVGFFFNIIIVYFRCLFYVFRSRSKICLRDGV